jgi:Cd2+/Zn2+-exporting ATPase
MHQGFKMSDQALLSRYHVSGMDCVSCAAKIETALKRNPGVSEVSVSVPAGTVSIRHSRNASTAELASTILSLGYMVASDDEAARTGQGPHPHEHAFSEPWWRTRRGLLTIGVGLALLAAYVLGHIIPAANTPAFIIAVAVGLVPVARRAFVAARFGSPFSIEMLMTIAAIGAVVIGATEEAAIVVFLFLVGELLEGVAANRARASIQGLTALVPKTAFLDQNGQLQEVSAEDLKVGSVIVARPGDRIAADGIIIEGDSEIDEAPVTGESLPKRKQTGDEVFAGTVNGDGVIRIQVTASAKDNTIAHIVKLVEEAQDSKAPTERFIDRFSRYYTPGVVAAAALVAVFPPLVFGAPWSEWIYKGLAILLIGCPCALVISTPAAIAAGLSAGARRGLLLKGGVVLETLRKITTVVLDKTGTLTQGKPQVTDLLASSRTETEVLSLAAALEAGSSHPLALAILDHTKERGVSVPQASDAKAITGKGVTGKVGEAILFLNIAAGGHGARSRYTGAGAAHRVSPPGWEDGIGFARRRSGCRHYCDARRASRGCAGRTESFTGRRHQAGHADR